LVNDANFRSAFIAISQQALREAEEEKLKYLSNFVVNTALVEDLDATLNSIISSLLPRLRARPENQVRAKLARFEGALSAMSGHGAACEAPA
jgi:hypothetical protein